MPNTPSARKRLRQTETRRLRNKAVRSRMRGNEKLVLAKIEEGDKAGAQAMLADVYKSLDRAAKHRIIHPNTAANHKSRITRKLNAIG